MALDNGWWCSECEGNTLITGGLNGPHRAGLLVGRILPRSVGAVYSILQI